MKLYVINIAEDKMFNFTQNIKTYNGRNTRMKLFSQCHNAKYLSDKGIFAKPRLH